jgi:hypothetical protein
MLRWRRRRWNYFEWLWVRKRKGFIMSSWPAWMARMISPSFALQHEPFHWNYSEENFGAVALYFLLVMVGNLTLSNGGAVTRGRCLLTGDFLRRCRGLRSSVWVSFSLRPWTRHRNAVVLVLRQRWCRTGMCVRHFFLFSRHQPRNAGTISPIPVTELCWRLVRNRHVSPMCRYCLLYSPSGPPEFDRVRFNRTPNGLKVTPVRLPAVMQKSPSDAVLRRGVNNSIFQTRFLRANSSSIVHRYLFWRHGV